MLTLKVEWQIRYDKKMNSIYLISHKANDGLDFHLLLGNFLDEFYRAPPDKQAEMILREPEDMREPEYLPFLTATAHKLANDFSLSPPRRVFDRRCYLPGVKPYFGCGAKGNLRLLLMNKSPSESKRRNLFVDENVLVRV